MSLRHAQRLSPFTGFGDDPNTSVKFSIVTDGGRIADWAGGPKLSFHPIANSDREPTQYHGRKPWTLTCLLLFDTLDDLEALDALQGRRATLRYAWGVTKRAGGEPTMILSDRYLTLPDTMLVSLDVEATYRSGQAKALATFRRQSSGGSDLYGFAIYAEDEL